MEKGGRTLFILSIIILIALVAFLLFSSSSLFSFTGKVIDDSVAFENSATCTDSDGGIYSGEAGIVNVKKWWGKVKYVDYCGQDGTRDAPFLYEYYCDNGRAKTEVFECQNGCDSSACINGDNNLRTASVFSLPLPQNSKCFYSVNENLAECTKFYKDQCNEWGTCFKTMACPKYYNPVYDEQGIFYPSACWAEQLGVTQYTYGYSPQFKQFVRDLWFTPGTTSYDIKEPDIEFTYQGSGLVGWKTGTFIRSQIWRNSTAYSVLDYNIDIVEKKGDIESYDSSTATLVYGLKKKMLLVFVTFDDAYPESLLTEWTKEYEAPLNDYLRKKQNVDNPIQYEITPIVIVPPQGVERISTSHIYFSDEEVSSMYKEALLQLKDNTVKFDVLAISPVILKGFGGYYGYWRGMQFIEAPLIPDEVYSTTNKIQGINARAAFQTLFITLSHEILHDLGLLGDHVPMGYGTEFLGFVNQRTDMHTGKETPQTPSCDYLGISSDYYGMKLPSQLSIKVGEEPSGMMRDESSTGACIRGFYGNTYLKDYDSDSVYEMVHANNLIGKELQRSLGWTDIDGDGIAEIADSSPYGGIKTRNSYTRCSQDAIENCYVFKRTCIQEKCDSQPHLSFEILNSRVVHDNCIFVQVRLEEGTQGLVPLQCKEFNNDIVNIYAEVKYSWLKVEKPYGIVLLARKDSPSSFTSSSSKSTTTSSSSSG